MGCQHGQEPHGQACQDLKPACDQKGPIRPREEVWQCPPCH